MDKTQITPPEQHEKPRGKSLPSPGWFSRYFRELSVVVIGVAITFVGSNWIANRQEQQKLKQHLQAVKIELTDNLEVIRQAEDYYKKLALLTQYLESDAPENLDQERIDELNNFKEFVVLGNFFTLAAKTSAFEMLKSSGALNLIKDQELSRSILDSYTSLENSKVESDSYMSMKMTTIRNAIMENEQSFYGDILNPKFRKVFYFFAASLNLEVLFQRSASQIEQTLAIL